MILVAFISFVLFNYVGDPVNNMVGVDSFQFSGRRVLADLCHRHPADLCFLGLPERFAFLWPRRCCKNIRQLDLRFAYDQRLESHNPAVNHPLPLSADADTANRPGRNAGGAVDRLYQVRPGQRIDGQGHKLRACAQKHPCTRHHGHRPAGRFPDRLFHHYRDGFPVARHGGFVHPDGAFCGCSDYGRLYGFYGPFFRDHQSYRRFAVFRC